MGRIVTFQTPFGITACERAPVGPPISAPARFKRLSASLHVKGKSRAKAEALIICFKRLSASLHVKVATPKPLAKPPKFQTPFGITACERGSSVAGSYDRPGFKRLSASLHVKVDGKLRPVDEIRCFKRLSASLHVKDAVY